MLTTGSVALKTTQTDVNLFKMVQKMDEVLNEVKITNQHLQLITDTEIKEVEIKE